MVAREGTKEASKIPQLWSSRKRGRQRTESRVAVVAGHTTGTASRRKSPPLSRRKPFAALKAPIVRVAHADAPFPYSSPLEAYVTPTAAKIVGR